MRIVITNAYSLEQKGDSALLVGTIKQLAATFAQAELSAQVTAHTKAGQMYEGAQLLDSLVYIGLASDAPKLRRLPRMAGTLIGSIVWAWGSRVAGRSLGWVVSARLRRSLEAMWGADLIVPVAGGYLSAPSGGLETLNLVFVLLPMWVALALRRPVVSFPQSIGPLHTRFQRFMVARTITRLDLVTTRESVSTEFARGLGVRSERLAQSIDVGFLFTPEPNFGLADAFDSGHGPKPGKSMVGITTKNHLEPVGQARYERELASFCDWLVREQGMQVVFVPQITSVQLNEDDRVLSRRVFAMMRHRQGAYLIEKNLTNYQTKAVINQLDYMVGTRFHGVIFALTGYVPSIAVEYEHKTRGIMQDLGLSKWIIGMAEVRAPKLRVMFRRLVAERESYVAQLRRNLPPYLERSAAMRTLVQETYHQ